MKSIKSGEHSLPSLFATVARAFIVAGFLFALMPKGHAFSLGTPGDFGGFYSLPASLDTWSFTDTSNWTSDAEYAPVSFTNITAVRFGDGTSLALDTIVPAWLQYNVFESDGTTNLTVDSGTVAFWFSPNWASTNDATGGSGPENWGRLLEVGGYTPDSSYGWWSLYTDPAGVNIYFSAQTNDGFGNTYTISAPVDFTTNYWHFIALTYSSTNVSLYLDGILLTNDVGGLPFWPGTDVLANGFYVGSDSNGVYQAQGEFDDISTYNVVLDSNQVLRVFYYTQINYFLNPLNWLYMQPEISSAPFNPSTGGTPNVITGAGFLQRVGSATANYNANPYKVWLTNVTATATGGGNENVTFTIQGGQPGYFYDVFATAALQSPVANAVWFWMGQGNSATTYTLPITSNNAFLILGTPQDSDTDGLTDAYEMLVSHTNPTNNVSNLDGIQDGWEILLGLNPQTNNFTSPNQRINYGYTPADWLNAVSGVKPATTITTDNEGNVQSVSQ